LQVFDKGLRPALPVPRPGRDREARLVRNILWSLHYFASKLFVLMLCMPGLGQGSGPGYAARFDARFTSKGFEK